jgi:anti-sigma factor RsiW
MKWESQLKVQAFLDGELTAAEAREVEGWVRSDPEARDLAIDLRQTGQALQAGELARTTPEAREFYWSQIRRRIEAQATGARQAARRPVLFGWRYWLASLAGAAAVITFIGVAARQLPSTASAMSMADEIETMGDQEAVVFQDKEAKMTVVWCQAKPAFTSASVRDTLPPE